MIHTQEVKCWLRDQESVAFLLISYLQIVYTSEGIYTIYDNTNYSKLISLLKLLGMLPLPTIWNCFVWHTILVST